MLAQHVTECPLAGYHKVKYAPSASVFGHTKTTLASTEDH